MDTKNIHILTITENVSVIESCRSVIQFCVLSEPALKPVPKSISETVENGDSSTVNYTREETNEQGRVYIYL